jgi:hypothetical protein
VEMVLFADDINVLVIDNDKEIVQQKINKIMKQLETWFQANNLVPMLFPQMVLSA